MNQSMNELVSIVEDIKEKISDQEYKTMLELMKKIHEDKDKGKIVLKPNTFYKVKIWGNSIEYTQNNEKRAVIHSEIDELEGYYRTRDTCDRHHKNDCPCWTWEIKKKWVSMHTFSDIFDKCCFPLIRKFLALRNNMHQFGSHFRYCGETDYNSDDDPDIYQSERFIIADMEEMK